jgi:hypothetical protein
MWNCGFFTGLRRRNTSWNTAAGGAIQNCFLFCLLFSQGWWLGNWGMFGRHRRHTIYSLSPSLSFSATKQQEVLRTTTGEWSCTIWRVPSMASQWSCTIWRLPSRANNLTRSDAPTDCTTKPDRPQCRPRQMTTRSPWW